MKVLLFKHRSGAGGVQSWLLLLGRQLRQMGVDCRICFFERGTRSHDFQQLDWVQWSTPVALLTALERRAYDVVHVINEEPYRDLLALTRPVPKVIVTAQGELCEPWNGGDCFAYTAVSRGMAALNQPLTDLAIDVIPNAVDCKIFTPPAKPTGGRPVIAWVGRTGDPDQKDFPRFLRIASLLAGKGLRFWVADESGNSPAQFAALLEHGLSVERWGRVPHAEMPQFYRDVAASGGVLLTTSRFEGLPLVVIEGAACGLATVGPDVVGVNEAVLPGETGALFPANASDAVAGAAVLHWLDSRSDRCDAIEACAAAARREFSVEVMAQRYLAVYERGAQPPRAGLTPTCAPSTTLLGVLRERAHSSRWKREYALRHMVGAFADEGRLAAWRALVRLWRVKLRTSTRPRAVLGLLGTSATLTKWPLRRLRSSRQSLSKPAC